MYWKRQGYYEYLVRTQPDNKQARIGPRSPQTEASYSEFSARKLAVESRWKDMAAALAETTRMNKAVKAGRTPALVVALLQTLDDAGLGEHFTVVGTHALYAYETAAAVRIVPGALATQDVDLLWDARKRVRFVSDLRRLDSAMLQVLKRADKTFERKQGQNETAINSRGFEMDFLRRQSEGDDPHPFRFSADEDDLWPVQALRASVLTNAPRFSHMVISGTGQMAMMSTIAPTVYVDFKHWMAASAPGRPEAKRRRDQRQVDIVAALIEQGLLLPGLPG